MGTGIMLGNLSVEQIEKLHGFSFTEDEKEFLNENWHRVAHFEDGEAGWHMFGIQPFLVVSRGEIGSKCLDIFMAHHEDYAFQFSGGYGGVEVVE